MSWRLVAHVLDFAPSDLSAGEMLALIAIAETANDDTRQAWPGNDVLARRTRLHPDTLRKILHKLESEGNLTRISQGIDKNGRRVIAKKGRRAVYAIPVFSTQDETTQVETSQVVTLTQDEKSANPGRKVGQPRPKDPTLSSRTEKNRADPDIRDPRWRPHCGDPTCNKATSRIELGYNRTDGGPCPRCHPSAYKSKPKKIAV